MVQEKNASQKRVRVFLMAFVHGGACTTIVAMGNVMGK